MFNAGAIGISLLYFTEWVKTQASSENTACRRHRMKHIFTTLYDFKDFNGCTKGISLLSVNSEKTACRMCRIRRKVLFSKYTRLIKSLKITVVILQSRFSFHQIKLCYSSLFTIYRMIVLILESYHLHLHQIWCKMLLLPTLGPSCAWLLIAPLTTLRVLFLCFIIVIIIIVVIIINITMIMQASFLF